VLLNSSDNSDILLQIRISPILVESIIKSLTGERLVRLKSQLLNINKKRIKKEDIKKFGFIAGAIKIEAYSSC
jgi:hypothetical protein